MCDWLENGFTTKASMERAHQLICRVVASGGSQLTSILDLGCGNGRLLEALGAKRAYGVEREPRRARTMAQLTRGTVVIGDIGDVACWPGQNYDLILLMPGRLTQMSVERANTVLDAIRARTEWVLVYAYRDWLRKYCTLGDILNMVGLPTGPGEAIDDFEAMMLELRKGTLGFTHSD